MRTRLTVAAALMLVALVALAAIPSGASSPVPQERTLAIANDGEVVYLADTEMLVLRLETNPSTGYRWDVQEMTPSVLGRLAADEFEPLADPPGAPAIQVLRFAGAGRGETDLRLAYRRPWEAVAAPLATFNVQVRSQDRFVGTYTPEPALAADASLFRVPVAMQDMPAADLPAAHDGCYAIGGCTPVRNQGGCGSCWAFSTVGSFEQAIKAQDGVDQNLSEQYLVSCNTDGWGCDGGWFAHAYHLDKIPPSQSVAGARWESDFAYTATDAACVPGLPGRETLFNYVYVSGYYVAPVADIKDAIYNHGPVSAVICVDDGFRSYNSGVFSGSGCTSTNHAIVLTGWDDSIGANGAWRLRNSWGSGWGESGYMWIEYGANIVGYRTSYVEYSSSSCGDGACGASQLLPAKAGSLESD